MGESLLDTKDRKILSELDFNARQSNSEIARKVGLSKEVVNYRIKNLEKDGIITGYYAVLNIAKLGYMFCRIFLRLQNFNPKVEQELLEYSRKNKRIGWIIRTQGPFDLALVIFAKNINEFKNVSDEICWKFGSYFQSKFVSIATKIYHYKHKYLFESDKSNDAEWVLGGNIESGCDKLDDIDTKILGMLSKDGRMPLLKMSENLGLTPNTAKYRLKRLVDNNVILGFRAGIDIKKLKYQRYKVLLTLQNTTKEDHMKLIEFLRRSPHVVYITEAVGKADLEFEMDVFDIEALHSLINKMRQEFSEILKDHEACLTCKEEGINYFPLLKD
jgi:Lrp/AsnC family transcriptional regulator, leucine-responsive regulatory protein